MACNEDRMKLNLAYPRTCEDCGLGPCQKYGRRPLVAEEAEAIAVPRLVEAIYTVLIPFEPQDCRIQAENHKRITNLATDLWRAFAQRS